ncbi:MAG: succinyl-diaminopimelate desuccinylase [Gaiellaceae bacterium]|nr:succinyl-diaminopimelate desuccinylase [Gaiellaceae bacterium]
MATIAERLAARTLELVDIPSESRNEAAIAAHVAGLVPRSFEREYHGEDAAVFVRPRRPGRELVVLAGHYDTVPAQGNLPGRIEDGAVVGLGASDMKGGLAVLLELARELDERDAEPEVDLALLLFGREELPPEFNPLPHLFDHSPTVREAALAILLEPTDGAVHAGCLGNLNVRLVFRGVSGHSARPWAAENAIEAALEGLRTLAHVEPRPVDVRGLTFTEVVSVTQIHGGIADNSPAGRVVADSALVRRLRAAGELGLEPKQAWTNVADFTSRGIDAVNFGPGATRWAHARDERVEIAALEHAFASLWRFLTGSV